MLNKAEEIIQNLEATQIHVTALHNVAKEMCEKLSFAIRYSDTNGDYSKVSSEEANIYARILEFLDELNPLLINTEEERW